MRVIQTNGFFELVDADPHQTILHMINLKIELFDNIYKKIQNQNYYEIEEIIKKEKNEITEFITLVRHMNQNIYADPKKNKIDLDVQNILKHNKLGHFFDAIYTGGGGNCLYRAISNCLFGEQKYFKMLKISTVFTLIEYRLYYKSIIPIGKSFKNLILDVSTDGNYGDEYEHQAISIITLRPLIIFQNGPTTVEFCAEKNEKRLRAKPIAIMFVIDHFTSLLEKKNSKKFAYIRENLTYFDQPDKIYHY